MTAGTPAQETLVDLLVVGGGINGVGIARDAAGRGLSVALVEKADLASATSSASTKLIHGGLRYLEYYEFRLVREALSEREGSNHPDSYGCKETHVPPPVIPSLRARYPVPGAEKETARPSPSPSPSPDPSP